MKGGQNLGEVINSTGQNQSSSIAMRMKKNREAFITADQPRGFGVGATP